MTNEDIILIIKRLQKDWSDKRDGGRSFSVALAKKIDYTIENEKKEVIHFLLQEIEYNTNGLYSLAIATIEHLRSYDAANELEEIYKRQHWTKDDKWVKDILIVLAKKRYPSTIYDDYLKANPISSDSFFFLVHYVNLYPQKGIPLLADCLINHLHISSYLPSEDTHSFIGVTPYLLNLIVPPEEWATALVENVYEKDYKSGEHLKKFMVHLLKYYPHSLSKDFVTCIVLNLEKTPNQADNKMENQKA